MVCSQCSAILQEVEGCGVVAFERELERKKVVLLVMDKEADIVSWHSLP
jgi:hypothetical protein